MIRTQIQLREDQALALRRLAAQRRMSLAEIVRRAVDALLRNELPTGEQELRDRALAAAGRFASGLEDVAESHDEHLSRAFRD